MDPKFGGDLNARMRAGQPNESSQSNQNVEFPYVLGAMGVIPNMQNPAVLGTMGTTPNMQNQAVNPAVLATIGTMAGWQNPDPFQAAQAVNPASLGMMGETVDWRNLMASQAITLGNMVPSYLYYNMHQVAPPMQNVLGFINAIPSQQGTPTGSTIQTTDVGRIRGPENSSGRKSRKPFTLDDFPLIRDTLIKAKRTLVAEAFIVNPLPDGPEKRRMIKDIYVWILRCEPVPGAPSMIPNEAIQLVYNSLVKVKSAFGREAAQILEMAYGISTEVLKSVSQEAVNQMVWFLVGPDLGLIWQETDDNGYRIPFSHPGLRDGLSFLFFETTGCVGLDFVSWIGDRYPNCGIAFVLAWYEILARTFSTDETVRLEFERVSAEILTEPFNKYLDFVDGTERDEYYQQSHVARMREWYEEACLKALKGEQGTVPPQRAILTGDINRRLNYTQHVQNTIVWGLGSPAVNN